MTNTPDTLVTLPVSEDARNCLAIRSPLNRAIYSALREYRCSNMVDEDGCPYPLVDLLSNPAPADIGTGEMEMVALTDEIETAIDRLTAQSERVVEVLRGIVGACNEAMPLGPFDCIDNSGQPYQSADLADKLAAGRSLLARLGRGSE